MPSRCFLPAEKNSLPGDSLLFQTANKNLLMYRRKLGFMCQVCQMLVIIGISGLIFSKILHRTIPLPAHNTSKHLTRKILSHG